MPFITTAFCAVGMRLLEDDSLGGGGSRGSGRVKFSNINLTWRGKDYYANGTEQKALAAGVDLAALQSQVKEADGKFSLCVVEHAGFLALILSL